MLIGEGREQLVLGDEAARNGDLPGELAGVLRLVEDFPELVLVDEPEIDEHLAYLAAARAHFPLRGLCRRGTRLLGPARGGSRLLDASATFAVRCLRRGPGSRLRARRCRLGAWRDWLGARLPAASQAPPVSRS